MAQTEKPVVVIAGAGFSGTMVAVQLLKQTHVPMHIVLVDRARESYARGVAYQTQVWEHVLNVPAGKMSAFPEPADDFLQWLQGRGESADSLSFVPRQLYGQYLSDTLTHAQDQATGDVTFEQQVAEVEKIDLPDSQAQSATVELSNGQRLLAKCVVLAVGNHPGTLPSSPPSSFYQSHRFIRNVWSPGALAGIEQDKPLLIIGTGLTMVDKVLELKETYGHQGVIYAVSRRGLLPQVHDVSITPQALTLPPTVTHSTLALSRHLRQLILENNGDWRGVIDGLRPHTQTLWKGLSHSEKIRFLRHLRPYWDVHRHRMAPAVGHQIHKLMHSGVLQILAGRIQSYQEQGEQVHVDYLPRGENHLHRLQVSAVLNCTGSDANFRLRTEQVLQQLIGQGTIVPHPLGMGLNVSSNGALIDQSGNVSKVLYTLGPPLKGELWETTAVPEIRQQAAQLAKTIVSAMQSAVPVEQKSAV